jgi:hypothetical protein
MVADIHQTYKPAVRKRCPGIWRGVDSLKRSAVHSRHQSPLACRCWSGNTLRRNSDANGGMECRFLQARRADSIPLVRTCPCASARSSRACCGSSCESGTRSSGSSWPRRILNLLASIGFETGAIGLGRAGSLYFPGPRKLERPRGADRGHLVAIHRGPLAGNGSLSASASPRAILVTTVGAIAGVWSQSIHQGLRGPHRGIPAPDRLPDLVTGDLTLRLARRWRRSTQVMSATDRAPTAEAGAARGRAERGSSPRGPGRRRRPPRSHSLKNAVHSMRGFVQLSRPRVQSSAACEELLAGSPIGDRPPGGSVAGHPRSGGNVERRGAGRPPAGATRGPGSRRSGRRRIPRRAVVGFGRGYVRGRGPLGPGGARRAHQCAAQCGGSDAGSGGGAGRIGADRWPPRRPHP